MLQVQSGVSVNLPWKFDTRWQRQSCNWNNSHLGKRVFKTRLQQRHLFGWQRAGWLGWHSSSQQWCHCIDRHITNTVIADGAVGDGRLSVDDLCNTGRVGVSVWRLGRCTSAANHIVIQCLQRYPQQESFQSHCTSQVLISAVLGVTISTS